MHLSQFTHRIVRSLDRSARTGDRTRQFAMARPRPSGETVSPATDERVPRFQPCSLHGSEIPKLHQPDTLRVLFRERRRRHRDARRTCRRSGIAGRACVLYRGRGHRAGSPRRAFRCCHARRHCRCRCRSCRRARSCRKDLEDFFAHARQPNSTPKARVAGSCA